MCPIIELLIWDDSKQLLHELNKKYTYKTVSNINLRGIMEELQYKFFISSNFNYNFINFQKTISKLFLKRRQFYGSLL